jgi:hypothetical protein
MYVVNPDDADSILGSLTASSVGDIAGDSTASSHSGVQQQLLPSLATLASLVVSDNCHSANEIISNTSGTAGSKGVDSKNIRSQRIKDLKPLILLYLITKYKVMCKHDSSLESIQHVFVW